MLKHSVNHVIFDFSCARNFGEFHEYDNIAKLNTWKI